jgi:cephalosporin hydroxylase
MTWEAIPGWMAFGETYRDMVDSCPPGGTIVEVGVAFGRSAAYLARLVIDSGKDVKLWAVDPWFADWWLVPDQYPTHCARPTWGGEHAQFGRDLGGPFSAFVHCMRTHAPEELERLNVLRCKSSDAAKILGRCHGVLIDASHNYEDVVQDIALWRPHMMPGGILAGDDWSEADFPGVCRAVREAFGEGNFETRGTTWLVRT